MPDDKQTSAESVKEYLNTIIEQGKSLEQIFNNSISQKDEVIEKLHLELDRCRKEAGGTFSDQLMKEVIKIRRDMKKCMAGSRWERMTAEELRSEYSYVFESITDLLNMQGIDEFVSKEGDLFDASIHMARTEPTTDRSLDKRVHKLIAEGYMKNNKTLIPERVTVYQYKEEGK